MRFWSIVSVAGRWSISGHWHRGTPMENKNERIVKIETLLG